MLEVEFVELFVGCSFALVNEFVKYCLVPIHLLIVDEQTLQGKFRKFVLSENGSIFYTYLTG